MIGFSILLYYSLYPPLVYLTFMHKFFKTAEHWPLKHKADEQRRRRQLEREEKRKLQAEQKEQKEKEKEERNRRGLPLHLQIDSTGPSSVNSASSTGSGFALRDVLTDNEDDYLSA